MFVLLNLSVGDEVQHIASDIRTFASLWVFMQGPSVVYKIYGLVDFLSLWVAAVCFVHRGQAFTVKNRMPSYVKVSFN